MTTEERAELAELAAARKRGPLTKSAAQRFASLAGELRGGVIRTRSEAAVAYDCSPQLVKYWIGRGKKSGLPCPWTEPGKMKSWWDAMQSKGEFRRDAPARLVALAVASVTAADVPEPDEAPLPEAQWQGHDANLQQLRLIRARWGAAVAEATTIAGMQALLPRLEKIDTALINAERSYLRIATESRHLLPWVEVETAWTDAMHALKSAERSVLSRVLTALGAADRIDEIIDELYGGIAEALPPDLRPAA